MPYISKAVRRAVREDAGERCGYCRSSEAVSGLALQFEHILPESLGGDSSRENLWLACSRCNRNKSDRTEGVDPETGTLAAIYNPRKEVWEDHFLWIEGGALIEGRTSVGRGTVEALRLNEPLVVLARRLWIQWGVHPPDG
ncbi:MAG: HNH endonuclease signature motif containing protein [Verrucomicrobiota bacterium]